MAVPIAEPGGSAQPVFSLHAKPGRRENSAAWIRPTLFSRKHRRAFSLIELLVVIAVIAILAALLLPVLKNAKLRGQEAVCRNNLKQLELAHTMYTLDFGKELIYAVDVPNWRPMVPFVKNAESVQFCPSAPSRSPAPVAPFDPRGRSDLAYVAQGGLGPTLQASYAFNGWLYHVIHTDYTATGILIFDMAHVFPNVDTVQTPSQTPVFADSTWYECWPYPTNFPATDLLHGPPQGGTEVSQMAAFTIARHGDRPASAAPTSVDISQPLPGSINLAMYDGHVEKSRIENLWSYSWSYNWQVPGPRPGRIN